MSTEATASTRVTATRETICDLFVGVMIPCKDPPAIGGLEYQVPGWTCKACHWTAGAQGLPMPHDCPREGHEQWSNTDPDLPAWVAEALAVAAKAELQAAVDAVCPTCAGLGIVGRGGDPEGTYTTSTSPCPTCTPKAP